MAVSELQYAAELIDSEQRIFKFDDIGCLLRFARDRQLIGAPSGRVNVFVRDYSGNAWLEADKAQYVQSPEIPSPMASGLVAAQDTQRAEQHAARFHGRILGFAEIWKP